VVPNARLARDWSARPPREVWRQPVGLGWSSFAVVGAAAFTQEQRGDQELVVCYDLKTGKVRWTHADTARFHEAMGGDGPRSTPTVAGGRVYALGATGILNCLDGATGKLLWTRETLKGIPNLEWGKSSSPLVFDDLVLVSGGNTAGPSLLAFNKDNGNPVWQAGHDKSSYSSPVLADLAGRRQVVMVNARSVTGHDPADGHILWEYSWPGELAKASQPVVLEGDRVLLSAGYGLGCVLLQVKDEGGAAQAVSERWSNRYLKTQFSNVVVRDGFVYGLDDGVLTCLDLDTGKRRWKGGRYGYGQVLLAGDLILVQAESGSVVLVEATPDRHHELARLPALKGKTWNNPALAGPYLVVRNDQEAACYRLPLEEK
jgi:outer membrane protein assembly factor BamB